MIIPLPPRTWLTPWAPHVATEVGIMEGQLFYEVLFQKFQIVRLSIGALCSRLNCSKPYYLKFPYACISGMILLNLHENVVSKILGNWTLNFESMLRFPGIFHNWHKMIPLTLQTSKGLTKLITILPIKDNMPRMDCIIVCTNRYAPHDTFDSRKYS